jgi:hypothetical protein
MNIVLEYFQKNNIDSKKLLNYFSTSFLSITPSCVFTNLIINDLLDS